jgi:beta-lactamase superfamily II metal-dependent hydrolase
MLKLHFLNVGKGNCTIVEFPSGRLTMVDIDNSRIDDEDDVLTDPVSYFLSKFKDQSLFRFILTHPDMDHLSGLNEFAKKVSIGNFWDTNHNKSFTDDDWEGSPYDKKDWDRYLLLRKSEKDPKALQLYRDDTADCCWTQDGITILSPSSTLVKLANESEEYNHLSYVLRIEYAGIKVILGGDASTEAWDEIYNHYKDEFLKADIFLAPHHGSANNIHEDAFDAISPDYVIVSVAEGVDYDYNYYKKLAKKEVLSTKYYGTMRFEIKDDGNYDPIIVEKNA